MKKTLLFALLMVLGAPVLFAGNKLPDALSVKVRAAYSVGGTAPLDMPAAIRSIDSYKLTLSVMVGADAAYSFNKTWGIQSGLHFENKGMDAAITTKGYRMEMVQGDSRIEGLFTGHVHQKVTAWMFTLPVQATARLGIVTLKAGPYVSVLVSKNFSGTASDGYLRQGDPTGPKIVIGSKEGEWATYDFSNEIRPFQFGMNVGADFSIAGGFGISADLNWGLTGLLKSSFKTVDRPLYPIYATVGVFYAF
ncbi:MAG: PorT family protein [Bacteroidales bacterium]|nr:PorT family protein [Bacteroidales bacterium]